MSLQTLLVLLGPTAVGKTELSLQMAKSHHCEIISGDSMQVYRGMDIGTAKLPEDERRGIEHHMIDVVDPWVPFSASEFQQRTSDCIREIHKRAKQPFLVGGTGLYIESLCYGFSFSETTSDALFRNEMEQLAKHYGNEVVHHKLAQVDAESAARLHPNDLRRVIRALEVHHVSGMSMSAQLASQTKQPAYRLCLIGLRREREELYRRIDERVDVMMRMGLIEEVEQLLKAGCTPEMVSMQALGYKEMAWYLSDRMTLEDAVTLIKQKTRNFAKRQMSWFRHMPDIHWIDLSMSLQINEHFDEIHDIISKKFYSA